MNSKMLFGSLAFAALMGFNFRHAMNDYGLGMSSYLMAFASDGTDGTTGTSETGTGTDEIGTDGTDPIPTRYKKVNSIINLHCTNGVSKKIYQILQPSNQKVLISEVSFYENGDIFYSSDTKATELLKEIEEEDNTLYFIETSTVIYNNDAIKCTYEPCANGNIEQKYSDCMPTCKEPYKCGKIYDSES